MTTVSDTDKKQARLLNDALVLIKADKNKEAAEMLTASGVQTPLVLFQTALCYMQISDYDKAEAALKKHIEKEPSFDVYDLLLTVYLHKKDMKNAYTICKQLLSAKPGNERALFYFCLFSDIEYNIEEAQLLLNFIRVFTKPDKDLSAYPADTVITAMAKGFFAARRFGFLDMAYQCFDTASMIIKTKKSDNPVYGELLFAAYANIVYSDYYKDERVIEIMHELYEYGKPAHTNAISRDTSFFRNLRIGLLSSDFRFHPVGRFILALFANANPNTRVDYYCYDTYITPRDDVIAEALKKGAHTFKHIGSLPDDEAEKEILKDELDIVFELNGVSADNKRELVMRRLAPVQFTWIGFPQSCAAQNVDYIITDPVTDPPGYAARFYTETPVYMSKTFLCYPPIYEYETSLDLQDPPVTKNGYITFATFNNLLKYTPSILAVWKQILDRLPTARLTVVCATAGNDISKHGLNEIFSKSGIDITRVDFRQPTKVFGEYMVLYKNVDIILDTFPFNGATTTFDAFYMGVPVVSLTGTKHWERVGLSMLQNTGLADLAADTEDAYIETAVKLACDTKRLTDIRYTLRERLLKSPLSDTAAFKTEFENHMRLLFIKYCIENRKKPEKKTDTELLMEVICGLSFFHYLPPCGPFRAAGNQSTESIISRARDELVSLQLRLSRVLNNNEDTERYKKAVRLFSGTNDINEMRQTADLCNDLLAACAQ